MPSFDGDMEINQVLYDPFAWDQVDGYPAKYGLVRLTTG